MKCAYAIFVQAALRACACVCMCVSPILNCLSNSSWAPETHSCPMHTLVWQLDGLIGSQSHLCWNEKRGVSQSLENACFWSEVIFGYTKVPSHPSECLSQYESGKKFAVVPLDGFLLHQEQGRQARLWPCAGLCPCPLINSCNLALLADTVHMKIH